MKILAVMNEKLDDFLAIKSDMIKDSDIMLCGYGVLENIDLIEELKGNTNIIRHLVRVTEKYHNIAIAGINATLYNRLYRSAIVIENGKIFGISDMIHNLENGFDIGRSLRIYKTSLGKFGLIVSEDVMFPECARAMRLQGAKMLFHLTPKKSDYQQTAIAANALFNGIPIVTISRNDVITYNTNGEATTHINEISILEIDEKLSNYFINKLRPEIYCNVYTEE